MSRVKNNFLAERLRDIKNQDTVSFHVPGHKNGKLYERLGLSEYVQNLHKIDTTEIEGTDNLHSPIEVIKKAQERASKSFGSDRSFFLVNGTTCGIHAAIMACVSPGEKLIMDRNSHMSAFNSCILGDINTEYINSEVEKENLIPMPARADDVKKAIEMNKDAKAVYITSPTYYGDASDIEKISRAAHEKGMLVIVDCAHGSHLGLSDKLPQNPLECGADICIFSLHKTLSSFTQSSIMHVKGNLANPDRIQRFLAMLQSSSPSYLLMSSIDLCMGIYEEHGENLMEELIQNIDEFDLFMNRLKRLQRYKGAAQYFDETRIFVNTSRTGLSGYDVQQILRKEHNVQVEFATPYGIVLVSSIGNDKSDFERLRKALSRVDRIGSGKAINSHRGFENINPQKMLGLREAFYAQKQTIGFKEAAGRTSAEFVIPYPPGIPLVLPGEIITQQVIEYIQESRAMGMSINGMKDGSCEKICVLR